MLIVIAASLLVGRAVMRTAGSVRWSGLEPAVGLAAILAVEGLLARVPGNRWGLLLGLALLLAVALWLLMDGGRADLPELPGGLLVVLGVVFLAINLPFALAGHFGLPGVGYNNDLGLHLAWADWLRSGIGTTPESGYPLGPHGLATSLSFVPGLNLATVFTGQSMAVMMLTAWTAWSAVGRLGSWKRTLASVLVATPYLLVSYYAQAAFKEVIAALLLLAFVVAIDRATSDSPAEGEGSGRWRLLPFGVLAAGVVFTYSFPGLAWPAAVLAAVAVADPRIRARIRTGSVWGALRRPPVAAAILVSLGILLVLAFAGPFGFGSDFTVVAGSDAFGPVSAIEALGVWLDPDYRLDGITSTPVPILLGAVSLLALLASLWWWRREPSRVWPAAFFGCALLYLISLPWMGEYSLAKALVVPAPVTMTVILTGLLSGPPESGTPRRSLLRGGWTALAAAFIVGAVASSFLVLREASVAPPGHAAELTAFRGKIDGRSVLYLDQDRFAPWYLSGARVGVPLAEFPDPKVIENPKKPFRGRHVDVLIDFDSFAPETFGNFDFAITTAAGWQSMTPPFYHQVARTPNYILWRRTGRPFGRAIMPEGSMPAALVDCEKEGGRFFRQVDGEATLMPNSVVVGGDQWKPTPRPGPGESVSVTTDLAPGRWRVSLRYFSPDGLRLTAPGYSRRFEAALDGQRLANMEVGGVGPYWPGGVIRVRKRGPVTFTATTASPSLLQKLTGYSGKSVLGHLALMRVEPRRRTPMSAICGRWVDFFRWNAKGG